MSNYFKKIKSVFLNFVLLVIFTVGIISTSTIIILNSIWIYRIIVSKYNLDSVTNINKEVLVKNYSGLIEYLQNPFIKKLKFPNFIMSENGEIHFKEVKTIFLLLFTMSIIFLITIIILSISIKLKKIITRRTILKVVNNTSNILIVFIIGIGALYLMDFSWAFTMFHKIVFRNDYWLFDPVTDPIIDALPEDMFMIMGAAIVVLIVMFIVISKIIYYESKRKTVVSTKAIEYKSVS